MIRRVVKNPQLRGAMQSNPQLQGKMQSNPQLQGKMQSNPQLQGKMQSNPQLWGAMQSNPQLQGAKQSNPQLRGAVQGNPQFPRLQRNLLTGKLLHQKTQALRGKHQLQEIWTQKLRRHPQLRTPSSNPRLQKMLKPPMQVQEQGKRSPQLLKLNNPRLQILKMRVLNPQLLRVEVMKRNPRAQLLRLNHNPQLQGVQAL